MDAVLTRVEPGDPRERALADAFLADMAARYGRSRVPSPDPDRLRPPHGAVLLALAAGVPVARVGVVLLEEPGAAVVRAELRQLHVAEAARRRGLGARTATAAEEAAVRLGAGEAVLFVGHRQPEATAMYAALGYAPIAPYVETAARFPTFLGRTLVGTVGGPVEVAFALEPSDAEPGATLLREFVAHVDALYGPLDGPWPSAEPEELVAPHGAFLVGRVDGEPACCGAVRTIRDERGLRCAEVKRMWVRERWRGRGLAGRLLRALEAEAAALGLGRVRLDTGPLQPDALALYRRAGYEEIADYNGNVRAAHWLERTLG